MINNANKYSIAEIFNVDSRIKYVIPKFQREYTWNKDNWEELINDITESEGSHFIGSIICIKNPESDTYSPELELIDGQQRLTTISLLFCSMYKLLKEKMPNDNEDYSYHLTSLKGKIVNRSGGDIKLELSRQNNNFNDYKSVLDEIGVKDFSERPNNRGNRRIYKCFRYFLARLDDRGSGEILELLEKISNTLLVKIEVDSHSDAFMLFESLNNRGIPLSAIDLIKNKILAKLEGSGLMTADEAFDKWNLIINNLPDYSVQERFLRQYYNAFKYDKDLVKVSGITKATKSNIIKIYESLIDSRAEYIFKELIEKSSTYKYLISPENNDERIFSELQNELLDLINVKAAPSYILLLYLFSNKKYSQEFYKEVISFLVKYFIRRNITDFPNTRNLDQIFIDLIENIEEQTNEVSSGFISDWLSNRERMSSKELFEEKLRGDLYELNVDATRFILSKIEQSKSTREHFKDFWSRDNSDKLIWTIEHIFPEGKNIPIDWINMIADGDKAKAEKIQIDLVHKIGNLTLTGFNQNLSNFDFMVKRDRKNKENNYIGYKNGLYLNEDLKDREAWVETDIEKRTDKLVGVALDIFKID